jgi:hypothetical protein
VTYPTLTIASHRRHSTDCVCKGGPDRPILRPARLTGATPTTRTRGRLPSAPGIGPAIPSASPQSGVGLHLGAHCIYQARRQEGRCRSFERGASVGDRAVAGLVSRHGAAPGFKCLRPRSSSGAQSGRHQSAFQDHSERITTLHTATGNRYWPTASRGYFHIYARRRGRSPRTVAERSPVTLAVATHSLGVSPDTWRVLVVPSTVCLRGSFGSRERVASGDDLRS